MIQDTHLRKRRRVSVHERFNSHVVSEVVSSASSSAPACPQTPPPAAHHAPRALDVSGAAGEGNMRGGPYSGDFNGSSWNATALLAADPAKQRAKMAKAVGLCLPRDFTIVEEAHCLEGRCEMLKLPQGLTALWSHDSAAKGGVGIIPVSYTHLTLPTTAIV